MVPHIPATALLLAVAITGISCFITPPSENGLTGAPETPISDRRAFVDVNKINFLPTVNTGKKLGGWLPTFFWRPAVTEAPVIHGLAPVGPYPIYKVHKYKGIELRPINVIDPPRTLDVPPRSLDVPVVQDEVPRVINLPPYKPPATSYGVPAAEYGPPKDVAKESSTEASFVDMIGSEATEKAVSDEETQSSLDALSNLGSLTGLLGEGDANNLARLQTILQIFQGGKNPLTKLKNFKSKKLAQFIPQSAPAPAPASNAIYFPSKKESKSVLSSFIPSFLRSSLTPTPSPSVPLPILPEVAEVPFAGLENVRVPELPPINLPAFSTGSQISGPYVKVQVRPPSPIQAVVAPVIQPQYVPSPVAHYNTFPTNYVGNTPLYNSYGVVIPGDSYSAAASDQVPQYVTPSPNSQQDQMPANHKEDNSFRNESGFVPHYGEQVQRQLQEQERLQQQLQQEQQQLQQQQQQQQQQLQQHDRQFQQLNQDQEQQPQQHQQQEPQHQLRQLQQPQLALQEQEPVRTLEYEDNYDMQQMEEQEEMADPRSQ